jgi:hypothetical protein
MKYLLFCILLSGCKQSDRCHEEMELTNTAYALCKETYAETQKLINSQDQKILMLEQHIAHYRRVTKTQDSIISVYENLVGRTHQIISKKTAEAEFHKSFARVLQGQLDRAYSEKLKP